MRPEETNIVNRIQMILNGKGMTLAEVERKAELGNGTIKRWNTSFPSADKLFRVSQILGVTMEYLITGFNGQIKGDTNTNDVLRNLHSWARENLKDNQLLTATKHNVRIVSEEVLINIA